MWREDHERVEAGCGAQSASAPFVVDALDPDAVAQAVASGEPEVIVHELTARVV
jgi:hypothetical protein